ncbi:hypothetical protein G7077_02640 [Sphingomonas piscis]|uniref:Uncharacterized protein n=1 Tax=Sphingomonas piscis TaxID=2714943 RepID=A0A6G7YMK4_9SPHN|nr:hypothetical protein [Sphingomonas piscis]QIK77973.1 hypothetical protein G7077_02640 [Sphingomonas piscis]
MAEIISSGRGRPKKADEEAKRAAFTFRTTARLKDQLTAAAEKSERSIAQEIEMRLEMSFLEESLVGGPEMALFIKLLAGTVTLVELQTGKKWTEDRATWEGVSSAARFLLEGFQPQIDLDLFEKHRPAMWAFMEPAIELDRVSTKINGLKTAFLADEEMPVEVRRELEKAEAKQAELLKRVQKAAQAVFDGPLKEQEDRRAKAIDLGSEVAGKLMGKDRFNFEMGHGQGNDLRYAIGRMFVISGVVEPLDKLRPGRAMNDEDLLRGIRRIAAAIEARGAKPSEQEE